MRITLAFLLSLSIMLFSSGCDSADPEEELSGPATVTGIVLDSQTGDPIEGASVTFTRGEAARSDRSGPQPYGDNKR